MTTIATKVGSVFLDDAEELRVVEGGYLSSDPFPIHTKYTVHRRAAFG
jgi:hypothetical protein